MWLAEVPICQAVQLNHLKMDLLKERSLVSQAAVDMLGGGEGVEEGHTGARGGKGRRKGNKEF